ncbi:hypothetical protein OHR68_38920 [Spirillospora sp. NBC_00431]
MADDLFVSPTSGTQLQGVLMGPPVGDYIALWEENDVSFWRLSGSPPSMLGAGAMIRVDDETGRYRELGLLDRESGLLVLRDREPGPAGAPVSQVVPLAPVEAEEAKAESMQRGAEAAEWLGHVAIAAAARGEWLAIHKGSWQGPFEPVVVTELMQDDDGAWLSAVRATPVPTGAGLWSDHSVAPEAKSQQVTAAASQKAIGLSGALALMAFLEWDFHPLTLGMTFGPNPLGPWPD